MHAHTQYYVCFCKDFNNLPPSHLAMVLRCHPEFALKKFFVPNETSNAVYTMASHQFCIGFEYASNVKCHFTVLFFVYR